MKSVTIFLNCINDVKSFAEIISKHAGDFDLVCGRYTINAKSIMGIFSLDLSKNLRLDIHNESCYDEVTEQLKDFIVN